MPFLFFGSWLWGEYECKLMQPAGGWKLGICKEDRAKSERLTLICHTDFYINTSIAAWFDNRTEQINGTFCTHSG